MLGESRALAWGFAMAPHRLRALVQFILLCGCLHSVSLLVEPWLGLCVIVALPADSVFNILLSEITFHSLASTVNTDVSHWC